ncbi:Apolipoprotein C-IV [Heterocephalus glaber]|uniref:Apolipoprotein C-IV n=1 Tax=Heterocephalus glaber TaxID=10181 RepID=G5CBM4_HETGA|nr:Apolipoprotein C-IV [Heterocephalus glaber]
MLLPRHGSQALPALSLCILVLACAVAHTSAEDPSPRTGPEQSSWGLSRLRGLVEPMVTKTRERWQWFWGPEAFQGFMQTYYDDHLKDLGPRTQAWLISSKDRFLNKTLSLCPRVLCRDPGQD